MYKTGTGYREKKKDSDFIDHIIQWKIYDPRCMANIDHRDMI